MEFSGTYAMRDALTIGNVFAMRDMTMIRDTSTIGYTMRLL